MKKITSLAIVMVLIVSAFFMAGGSAFGIMAFANNGNSGNGKVVTSL